MLPFESNLRLLVPCVVSEKYTDGSKREFFEPFGGMKVENGSGKGRHGQGQLWEGLTAWDLPLVLRDGILDHGCPVEEPQDLSAIWISSRQSREFEEFCTHSVENVHTERRARLLSVGLGPLNLLRQGRW